MTPLFARICEQLERLRAAGWVPKRVYISTASRLEICAAAVAFFEPSECIEALFQPGKLGRISQVEWFVRLDVARDEYEIALACRVEA